MKGLLIKDFKLMKGQKNFFLSIMLICIFMIFISKDFSFSIGFLGFVGSLFTLSSISYDEFDNGNPFLFSLPITRKLYVMEKYLFGLIVGGVLLLFGTLLSLIAVIVNNAGSISDVLITALTIMPSIVILLSIMLPFHLKFGSEKGRIAIIAVIGIIAVVGFVLKTILTQLNLMHFLYELPNLSYQIYIGIFILISILALLISYMISLKIINKKEF